MLSAAITKNRQLSTIENIPGKIKLIEKSQATCTNPLKFKAPKILKAM